MNAWKKKEKTNVYKIYNYRLRSNDVDGAFTYSKITSIVSGVSQSNSENSVPNIFPNPVRDKLNIAFNLPRTENISIVLTDVLGRIMYT